MMPDQINLTDEDYNYFSDTNISEEERRDHAFQIVNGVRESVSLAKNATQPITYKFAFDIIHDLDAELHRKILKLLISKNESEIVKFYKEKAEALSDDEDIVEPIELIEKDIKEIDEILKKKPAKSLHLKKHKFGLVAAQDFFTPVKQSEHKSLNHDFYLSGREDFFGKPIYSSDSYKDYKITDTKILRLRLLHPDKEEEILGVDFIYEHFDISQWRVRFAHMQYKSWNDNTLYLSQARNLSSQLKKMKEHLCDSKYCEGPEDGRSNYRFPYCSAFLRPTSKLQSNESKLITTGVHIPICQAMLLLDAEAKITRESIKDQSIKGDIFEELFINNIAGSRWINIDELEEFYKLKGITTNLNTIRLHAQEIDVNIKQDKFLAQ